MADILSLVQTVCAVGSFAGSLVVMLYVRGKTDGGQSQTVADSGKRINGLQVAWEAIRQRMDILDGKAIKLEAKTEMHGEECERRYQEIQQTQERLVDAIEKFKEKVELKFDNLSGQINNLANDRAGRAYEIIKPMEKPHERS